jgi:hypothetical protein
MESLGADLPERTKPALIEKPYVTNDNSSNTKKLNKKLVGNRACYEKTRRKSDLLPLTCQIRSYAQDSETHGKAEKTDTFYEESSLC